MTVLGVVFPPDQPPERLRPVALAADRAGLEQLWLWEDCFAESAIATAATALGWTRQLTVGIGLMPVPLRNVALTAMELATLERLFPGRLVPGIGHGVLDWMGQAGVRASSPMTLLREYTVALRALLRGERVTTTGRYVRLADVALAWPPAGAQPPLLLGAVGEKTMRLAGEVADGVILTGGATVQHVREAGEWLRAARLATGREGDADIVTFVGGDRSHDATAVAEQVRAYTSAGASHVALIAVGAGGRSLEEYVGFVAREVRPLVE